MAVIGLDGVSVPLVRDLTARGLMPNLAQLLAGGTVAPMRSSIPVISSVSWTSFMTGRNPGKHGVYGFTDVKPGTFTMFFPNFGNVRSDTLWDVAGRAGKRSIVLNVPNTYPARPLEGLLVSGFVAVNLERAVFPPSLLPRLQAENYRIDVDYLNADQRPEPFFEDLHAAVEEIFLGREVVEDRPRRDVGFPGHLGDGDGVEAPLDEEPPRRLRDLHPCLLLLPLPKAEFGGHDSHSIDLLDVGLLLLLL